MAYVVAVCGAGGKSTLWREIAEEYLKTHSSVAITTTTHMWYENKISNIRDVQYIDNSIIYYYGLVDGDKVGPVGLSDYKEICEKFDYVVIAIGAHKESKAGFNGDDKCINAHKFLRDFNDNNGKLNIGKKKTDFLPDI